MARNFTIVLEGGIVQAVVTDDLEMIGVGFDVVDYDTDGREENEVHKIQDGPYINTAIVYGGYVEKSEIKILEKEDDETHASS